MGTLLTQEEKEKWVDMAIAWLDEEAAVDTVQISIKKSDWKEVLPVFPELSAIALRKGVVLHALAPDEKHGPRIRVSRFPLLVKLAQVTEKVDPDGVLVASETEKRALAWIKQASGLRELQVLTLTVMELEVRSTSKGQMTPELGAYARLAQILMDNYDERVSEVH